VNKQVKRIFILLVLFYFSISSFAATRFSKWHHEPEPLLTNFFNMYHPCVLEIDDAVFPYRMWFFGWSTGLANPGFSGADAMFCARSKDLIKWEVYAGDDNWNSTMKPELWKPIMTADDEPYDQWHVGDPSVVYKDGVYFMAFSATSNPFGTIPSYPSGMLLFVRGAVSIDGIHWKKAPKTLIDADYETPTKPNPGRVGDFHRPCLMWDCGKWKLWFDYWNDTASQISMGYAENDGDFFAEGGFIVKHNLKKPLINNWPNPEVIKIEGKYYGYSDPQGFGDYDVNNSEGVWLTRQLRQAVSDDGVKWKLEDFIPRSKKSDVFHVPQSFVTKIDGQRRQYLFYAVMRGGQFNGGFDYRYKSINAMWRTIYSN